VINSEISPKTDEVVAHDIERQLRRLFQSRYWIQGPLLHYSVNENKVDEARTINETLKNPPEVCLELIG
jgi:hypothetical protein